MLFIVRAKNQIVRWGEPAATTWVVHLVVLLQMLAHKLQNQWSFYLKKKKKKSDHWIWSLALETCGDKSGWHPDKYTVYTFSILEMYSWLGVTMVIMMFTAAKMFYIGNKNSKKWAMWITDEAHNVGIKTGRINK
jgi:hypothetical protein